MAQNFVAGIITNEDKAMVLKDENGNLYLPKYPVDNVTDTTYDEPFLDIFYEGIRKTVGFKRDRMMFLKSIGNMTVKVKGITGRARVLLFKFFCYELPTSYKGQQLEWVDLWDLHKVLGKEEESDFCEYKRSEIYNAKNDLTHSRPYYPSRGIR